MLQSQAYFLVMENVLYFFDAPYNQMIALLSLVTATMPGHRVA